MTCQHEPCSRNPGRMLIQFSINTLLLKFHQTRSLQKQVLHDTTAKGKIQKSIAIKFIWHAEFLAKKNSPREGQIHFNSSLFQGQRFTYYKTCITSDLYLIILHGATSNHKIKETNLHKFKLRIKDLSAAVITRLRMLPATPTTKRCNIPFTDE